MARSSRSALFYFLCKQYDDHPSKNIVFELTFGKISGCGDPLGRGREGDNVKLLSLLR